MVECEMRPKIVYVVSYFFIFIPSSVFCAYQSKMCFSLSDCKGHQMASCLLCEQHFMKHNPKPVSGYKGEADADRMNPLRNHQLAADDRRNTPMRRLYGFLFDSYKRDVRPVLNDSHSINVSVKFWLKQILKVHAADQLLNVYCWLELYWVDEYLKWNPDDFGGITAMHVPAKTVWQPDLLVYNNANMNIEENELETNVLLSHEGHVSLFRSVITDITCNLDLTYFPFDEQVCYIMLASWSYDGSKMMLAEKQPVVTNDVKNEHLEFYINNSEWNMEDFKSRQNMKVYECCQHPYPDISYYFVLSRNPAYYILSLVIPSAFITVVTVIGFFTPHSSTGENNEKVSLGVTALLSMAIIMMMVGDDMPATSRVMPLIGKYYIGLIFILFLAAFNTTLTLSIQMRGISDDPPPRWVKFLYFDILARCFFINFMLPECSDVPRTRKEKPTHKLINLDYENVMNRSTTEDFHYVECSKTKPANNNNSKNTKGSKARDHNGLYRMGASDGSSSLIGQSFAVAEQLPIIDDDRTEAPELSMDFGNVHEHKPAPKAPSQNHHSHIPHQRPATTVTQASSAVDKLQKLLPNDVLGDISTAVNAIHDDLQEKLQRERIAKQWRQISRITERTLMIVYIAGVAIFAAVMLGGRADKIVISDLLMNQLSGIKNSTSNSDN